MTTHPGTAEGDRFTALVRARDLRLGRGVIETGGVHDDVD